MLHKVGDDQAVLLKALVKQSPDGNHIFSAKNGYPRRHKGFPTNEGFVGIFSIGLGLPSGALWWYGKDSNNRSPTRPDRVRANLRAGSIDAQRPAKARRDRVCSNAGRRAENTRFGRACLDRCGECAGEQGWVSRLSDYLWNIRQNRALAETTSARRGYWLDGCDRELPPARKFYCTDGHGNCARQRRRRPTQTPAAALEAITSLGAALIAEDGRRGRRPICRRHPIGRLGDDERIFDWVRPNEGRLRSENKKSLGMPPSYAMLEEAGNQNPAFSSALLDVFGLTAAQREALGDSVCRTCKRFAVDCALITEHQIVKVRAVLVIECVPAEKRMAA